MRLILQGGAIAAVVLAAASAPAAQAKEIPSALSIAKSSNKNQVHYAVSVDDACAPRGSAPVRAYWRMLEKSADATEPLGHMEERAFGIAQQSANADDIHVELRALPSRPITIHTTKNADGTCSATATATIAGTSARISDVYVKIKLFGAEYVQLTGVANDGRVVRERLSV
jgi:hypothetical protein